MANRNFTLEEANALLPFLEERLQQLQLLQKAAQARFEEMEKIKAVGYGNDGSLILAYDFKKSKEDFDRTVASANEIIGKIASCGCHLKNIEMGLIDFPSRIGGEDVLLCWQLGETSLRFYHHHSDGFSGRLPIPDEGCQNDAAHPDKDRKEA